MRTVTQRALLPAVIDVADSEDVQGSCWLNTISWNYFPDFYTQRDNIRCFSEQTIKSMGRAIGFVGHVSGPKSQRCQRTFSESPTRAPIFHVVVVVNETES